MLLVSVVGAVPATGNTLGTGLVISQVYGGGGNAGATYTHDFVEVFNPTGAAISLTGLSVQYTSAAGTGSFGGATNLITPLSGSLGAGRYLLVQEASQAAVGSPLPTPDVTDATPIAMAAGAGKVALVNSSSSLGCNGSSTPCSGAQTALIIDLVGYGNANYFEGSGPTGTLLTSTSAAFRNNDGCTDSDNNAADFTAATPPAPRNTASPVKACNALTLSIDDVSHPEGNAATTQYDFTVSLSAPAPPGGVTFDIETADDSATLADNDYNQNSLTGQTIPATQSTYSFSVDAIGDTNVEPDERFFVNVTNVTGFGVTVAKGQGVGTIVNDDCGVPYTPIHDIQGNGLSTPIPGTVATEGIVVGDFEGPISSGLQGVYIQDPAADADPATSEGIFVFTGNTDNGLSAGDRVRVGGYARERFNQTTINGS
ncbi:MAG: lamin tail domain-containing protein, partial [Gaiellaceae bacterium]